MLKINYKRALGFVLSLVILVIPLFIYAQAGGSGTTIKNPLKSDSVTGILESILDLVAVVGSIVVVFFIIWSGYKLVMAKGNPGEMTKAKDMLLATVIGGAILLGADIIANVVVNTVETTVGTTAP